MISRFSLFTLKAALFAAVTVVNCRPAVYGIVKPKKAPNDPQNFGPTAAPEQAAPTAAIEVIRNGLSVTKVRVNEPTTIQPTADTVDPDDLGTSSCPNPGIVLAQYKIGEEASPQVDRGSKCDALSVPYTFSKPGEYLITLTVKSNEGETAFASMTLHVIAANAPADEDGGFLIKASPMIVGIGQEIAFSGICTTAKPHQITWTFGDDAKGEGATTKHAYAKVGPYRVDAVCRETATNGKTWTAAVTVVVMEKPVTPPASATPPGYTIPGAGPGGDVGQNGPDRPGQTPGVGQNPVPGQPPATFPWHHGQPAPGTPAPQAPKKCGFLVFRWSC